MYFNNESIQSKDQPKQLNCDTGHLAVCRRAGTAYIGVYAVTAMLLESTWTSLQAQCTSQLSAETALCCTWAGWVKAADSATSDARKGQVGLSQGRRTP